MLNGILALELIIKNAIFRKFDYKPTSLLTDILFYNPDVELTLIGKLDPEAIITEQKIDAEISFSGFVFDFKMTSEKAFSQSQNRFNLITLLINKQLTIKKDNVVIYKNGHISPEYSKEKDNIQNAIFFLSEELKNK